MDARKIKQQLPWWLKIGSKIVLARLPISYGLWKKVGLFELGRMDQAEFPLKSVQRHLDHLEHVGLKKPEPGFSYLEMGPGDSIASALVAKALGAGKIYLLDIGDFATRDLSTYTRIANYIRSQGYKLEVDLFSFQTILDTCNITYLTNGLESWKEIPDNSVDFCWSQSVLEHVGRYEFLYTFEELHRVLRPTGLSCHTVDLADHFEHALHNLRFSEGIWESDFMTKSGFYTNRLRRCEMMELFRKAGFDPHEVWTHSWPEGLPTPREKFHPYFQQFSDEELSLTSFAVVLEPKEK